MEAGAPTLVLPTRVGCASPTFRAIRKTTSWKNKSQKAKNSENKTENRDSSYLIQASSRLFEEIIMPSSSKKSSSRPKRSKGSSHKSSRDKEEKPEQFDQLPIADSHQVVVEESYGNMHHHQAPAFDEEHFQILQKQGFSSGLAKALATNANSFFQRIWIVDNSGMLLRVSCNFPTFPHKNRR